ncbi:hypothetical protein DET57_114165 [Klebsiella oxytoca]|uniref:Uncharacterized protein n=1 Tax=Klebsiella oxytoca TaxID=571 RepID=A0A318FKV6_KLEOX|nr:hypothetical protein [Klebsiella oxytoca]PXW42173.1 hypothetical protein DET57_114165 [Klebsiella oxytoca]
MARKEITITMPETSGRDAGKVFLIREKSADEVEWWAMRVLLALGGSGVDIPDDIASRGAVGIAIEGLSLLMKIPPAEAKPLLDEMMSCVEISPGPDVRRALVKEDIEEVTTRFALRKEILNLHVGFFQKDAA